MLPVNRERGRSSWLSRAERARCVWVPRAPVVVLVHTHPGGGPPSADDHAVTRRLVAASAVCGVRLAAHLVLAPEGQWDCLAA